MSILESNSWQIVDGRLEVEENSEFRTMRAQEIWDNRDSDTILVNKIELLGYGELCIDISNVEKELPRIIVKSEGHEFVLAKNFFPLLDYVIVQKDFWIPLYVNEVDIVNRIVSSFDILTKQPISAIAYVELMKLKYSRLLEVRVGQLPDLYFDTTVPNFELPNLKVTPYDYQKEGMRWLISIYNSGISGILADQMGLGKTIQLLALALHAITFPRDTSIRVLIVVPNSLLENWKSEFKKFVSDSYDIYVHSGPERERYAGALEGHDIILTTYDTLNRDCEFLEQLEWNLIICDEAQSLKNNRTIRHQSISRLRSSCKILATGTPVENQLMDLWSMMNLILPGIMGDEKNFRLTYDNNPIDAFLLGQSMRPLILRRKTREVLSQLPPEVKKDEIINPTPEFSRIYEIIRSDVSVGSIEKLQTLRLYCCYPPLVVKDIGSIEDAKAERLLEILDSVQMHDNEKVIIFTSFHDSSDYLSSLLRSQYPGSAVYQLDGRIKDKIKREEILNSFKDYVGFSILIASPRVAGEGLNIVSANHVIHFNLDWNPQKEDQASARVSRPGQEKTVFVHRLFYLNTVEEYINQIAENKRQLAERVLIHSEMEGSQKSITEALSFRPSNDLDGSENSANGSIRINWGSCIRRDK